MTTQNIDSAPKSPNQGHLTLVSDNHRKTVEISTYVVVGRDSLNAFSIDDPFVSGRHFRIDKTDSGFICKDLRSRNGTLVNGALVREAILQSGDVIEIGATRFTFNARKDSETTDTTITSKNQKWDAQLKRLSNVAQEELPVLITGPTGSGKEVMSRWIHENSPRKNGPFLSVNCGALTENLVESELFGHVKGSFTGAMNDRKGAFQVARGGTLFLDEIGDLPLALQPKLLRALENEEIRPVGSDTTIHTDVRIVAATHQNLANHVAKGLFREDLFYRLNVMRVYTPALRDRIEDFEDIFYPFAKQFRVRFSFGAIQKLKSYEWPGNIRELKNVVARAGALFSKQEITEDLVDQLIDKPMFKAAPMELMNGKNVIKDVEKQLILTTLAGNHGNQRKTADQLGIPKSTLNDRLKTYGVNPKELNLN